MKNTFKFLALPIAISMLAASCSNYGKKITFEGTKGEVFYKGDGVTEADAKKLGNYLKTLDYINNNKESSYQITKKGDTYTLKMVIVKAIHDTVKGIDDSYKALGVLVSKNVFDNKKVDVSLANDVFEEFKNIPYDVAFAKAMDTDGAGSDGFGKDILIDGTKGEVYVKGDGITDADAQKLGQHLREINFLSNEAPASVQLLKNNDGYIVRFVYDKNFYDTAANINDKFNIIRQSISTNVFGGQKVDIRLANNAMEDFATIPNQ